MKKELKFFPIFTIFLTLLTIVLVGYSAIRQEQQEKRVEIERRKTFLKLHAQFIDEIKKAKRITGDPCSSVFYQLVIPPTGLDNYTQLVIMGREISSVKSPMDISTYQLRGNGENVELWTNFVGAQRYDKKSLTWAKIGEKFPAESKICAGK